MSSFAKVGSFAARTGTGSQAITGLGFQPKALIVWGELTPIVASGFTTFRYSFFGMADGVTQIGYSASENRAVTPSDVNTAGSNTILIFGKSFNNSSEMIASLTSLDADGFTLSWSNNSFGSTCTFFYLAIGGSSVNAKLGSFNTSGAGPGNQSITGVGFKPTVLFGASSLSDSGVNQGSQSFGWSSGIVDGSYLVNARNAANPSHTISYQVDSLFTDINLATDTLRARGTISSFDNDGFTVNFATNTTIISFYYLALNGLSVVAGKTTQPAVTGVQSIDTFVSSPLAVLLMGVNQIGSSSIQSGLALSRGGISSGVQVSAWTGSLDGNAVTESGRVHRTNVALEHAHNAAPASFATLDAEATGSLGTTSIELNWTTIVSATAREFLYLYIAQPITPPTTNAGPDQQIFTVNTTLAGSVTGDATPTALWAKISGAGTVTFDDDTDPTTSVSFSHRGTYVLRLTGTNPAGSTSDDVTISFVGLVVNAGDETEVTLADGIDLDGSFELVAD